jgi:hypothetical protein
MPKPILNSARIVPRIRQRVPAGDNKAKAGALTNALYPEVAEVETEPDTADRDITCQVCGGSLAGQEGKFLLKYFLLRKAVRRRRQGRAKAV